MLPTKTMYCLICAKEEEAMGARQGFTVFSFIGYMQQNGFNILFLFQGISSILLLIWNRVTG